MSVEENKAIARGYLEAFSSGNLAAMDTYIAPDYVRHDPGLPFQVRGPEGVKQFISAVHTAFPDYRTDIEDVIAEGDKVLLRLTWHGTHQGELLGLPPTDKRVTVSVMDLFRIADDKIVEQWAIGDNLGLMQQLGVVPAPEQATA